MLCSKTSKGLWHPLDVTFFCISILFGIETLTKTSGWWGFQKIWHFGHPTIKVCQILKYFFSGDWILLLYMDIRSLKSTCLNSYNCDRAFCSKYFHFTAYPWWFKPEIFGEKKPCSKHESSPETFRETSTYNQVKSYLHQKLISKLGTPWWLIGLPKFFWVSFSNTILEFDSKSKCLLTFGSLGQRFPSSPEA